MPVLSKPHIKKKYFLILKSSCVSVCPSCLVLPVSTNGKSLSLSSLHPPFRYFCTWVRLLPFSRLNIPSSLGLSSQERCFSLFVIIVALHWTLSSMPVSLLTWVAQKQTLDSRYSLTSAEQRGRITFLSMQPTLLPFQPNILLFFFAADLVQNSLSYAGFPVEFVIQMCLSRRRFR